MKTANIFEIKPFAVHDGPGIRTTVFFKGCPLRCVWCHNPEGLFKAPQLAAYAHKCISCGSCAAACPQGAHQLREGSHVFLRENCISCGTCVGVCPQNALTLYGKEVTLEWLLPQLLADKEFYDASGGGVTLSGGECLLQPDFCAALLRELKANGIHTAVDTCGAVPREAFDMVLPYTDLFLYDVKAVDSSLHRRLTGRDNEQILKNLLALDRVGAEIELRVPVIPGCNDSEPDAIRAFAKTLRHPHKLTLLPYHNLAGSKYAALGLKNILPPVE